MAWSYHFFNKLCSVQIKRPFLAVTKAVYQHVQMLAGVPSPQCTQRSGRCTSTETTPITTKRDRTTQKSWHREGSILQRTDKSLNDRNLLLTVYDDSVQGRFLTSENTMQLDAGWQNRLITFSPGLTKFLLNAIHDVASTPNNLKLWNYSSSNNCPLRGRQQCNLKHILTYCLVSLRQVRYNWRHDQSHRENDRGQAGRDKQLDSQDTSREEMGEVPVWQSSLQETRSSP